MANDKSRISRRDALKRIGKMAAAISAAAVVPAELLAAKPRTFGIGYNSFTPSTTPSTPATTPSRPTAPAQRNTPRKQPSPGPGSNRSPRYSDYLNTYNSHATYSSRYTSYSSYGNSYSDYISYASYY